MPKKTYVPGANDKAKDLDRYLSQYEAVLVNGKTSDQIAALAALIECLATFISKWPKPPVVN